jgi:signal transduction histidine kinase
MLEQAEAVSRLGSWAFDSDTGHLRWSPQMFRNMGMPWSEVPPSIDAYCERIHPDDVRQVRAAIERLVHAQDVPTVAFRTHPAFGPARWMRRTVHRIPRDAEGRGPRYIGILLDITEAVEAEERLSRLNQELERRVAERTEQLSVANRELEAFSYTVSHDLKAPLRGIDGYSQLLVEEYGARLDDDGRLFVQRIRQGVQQMVELISDLLEYSRMERRDMAQEPVSLQPLIEQILDSYHADIEQQGTQVRLSLEPVTLPLDREGISVVLRNLIGNALKFSRGSAAPAIEVGVSTESGRRILWVRDNGVGFDMKYHDRIFGIFQRLHRPEEFPGTGVGLALVAKAVQRMGGRVWAESALGAGATFYLEFPV